jgi:hypothetical protein
MTQQETESESVEFGFSVTFDTVGEALRSKLDLNGYNEHGVKEYDDGSIDVVYRAMEPGTRNGLEITADFLQTTVGYQYGSLPFQMDHSLSQHDNVGSIGELWFRDGALGLRGHIPNTGSSTRSDVIDDFTHDPPAITDGSISFDNRTVEYDLPEGYESIEQWFWFGDHENEHPELVDAKVQEFSLTPFPGGYDTESGGLSPAFQEQFGNPPSGSERARRGGLDDGGRVRGSARPIGGPFSVTQK